MKSEFDIITLFASVFSIVGGFFLVRSIILTGSRQIAAMSGTYIGSNPHLESSLVEQKADGIVGFAMTLVGGLLSGVGVFYNYNLSSIIQTSLTLIFALVVVGILGQLASKLIFSKMYLKVRAISFGLHVKGYLRPSSISMFNAEELLTEAKRKGLGGLLEPHLDTYANLAKILNFAGAKPGAKHILELRDKETKKDVT